MLFHLILFCISFYKKLLWCSTYRSGKYCYSAVFGKQLDIHTGGIDLAFLIMKMKLHSVRCIISVSNGGIIFCILVSKILIT